MALRNGDEMDIKEISVRNFKSLYDVSLEPGKINVLIGANGSGKSSVLEAIGILSAAMTDRVNNNSLQRKGVRLSASSLYKSQFSSIDRSMPTIDFAMKWKREGNIYDYSVHLTTPTDDDIWKYHSESVSKNGEMVFGRSNRSSVQLNNKVGYFALSDKLSGKEYTSMGDYISGYGIYQPDTLTLRGTVTDPAQVTPIGLNGGRLADAMEDLFSVNEEGGLFGRMSMEDVLELIEWASDFRIAKPRKSNLNPGVPSPRQVIEFRDQFLKEKASFTGYDASEGALYVLFMLTLAMHPSAPEMFAIDSFDHALNPRLAKRVTEIFSQLIVNAGKTVFMTTHNPLVLDGLNLADDRIRLFAVNRSRSGYVQLKRIRISDELLQTGQSLSRLWINGMLGGVPELI